METLNILPINDVQQHKEDEHCMCNPTTRIHFGVKIVTHNAFDGRDIEEAREELANVNNEKKG